MLAQTIAHYRIQAKIGAGGMGEVYRATDTRLSRDVAIKVLPEALACDASRMARFEREAKVLASLNHPNIASIYGLEESNGTRALIMELVEGLTLAERIKQGPFALDEALPIAKQIAEGLEYAHERGIVHRDLKPSNVKLTPDGQVKVLDFGLAKALQGETSEEELQNSPTLSAAATRAGMLLGTAAYMSPEQARGKRVDRRADIWAFGCVLYEMLSGRDAFGGETTSDILACVIRAEPDWARLPQKTPTRIRELLHRCLTKDPKQRLQAIGDARIVIEEAIAGASEKATELNEAAKPQTVWRRALPWAVASIAAAFAIAFSALYWRASQPQPQQVMQASLLLSEPLAGVFSANPGSPIALSPDGSRLVFVGSPAGKPQQLYLRQLDQQIAAPIPGTEDAVQPFFSPDGQWLGFFADGKMRKVSLHGGPATVLCDAPIPHGANWASDDTIVYAPNLGSGLMRISSAGGTPKMLTAADVKGQELSHRWPQVLPGNRAVLFTIQMMTQASYDDARVALLSLETGKWRTLFDGGSYARYVPSGHIVYARAGALMAVPFDLARLQVTGPAAPVQDGVITTAATSGGAEYDVAESGLLAYVPGSARPPDRSLAWVDRQGVSKELPAPLNISISLSPRISPDGKQLAVQIFGGGSQDIWIYEFARNTLMRFTFGGDGAVPLWSADGRRILYRSRVPALSFRSRLADGTGAEETLLGKDFDDPSATPYSVSPDGKILLFGRHGSAGAIGTYALSLDGNGKVQPFLQATFNQFQAQFSPDGHWVVYASNESGRDELYVQPFPGPGGKWMISTDGGNYARWARNGREILFRNADKMMSVPVETQPTFKAGTPRMLFQGGSYLGVENYDVAPDGQHFLMIKEKEAPASSKELNVILHWTDELKRRVSPRNK
jgi:serine/threonine protein kinase/Tol biopolymer transport system component